LIANSSKDSIESSNNILAAIEQIRNELNIIFKDTITINSIHLTLDNNVIYLSVELYFDSNINAESVNDFCTQFKNRIEPVSDRKFNECVYPPSAQYVSGNTVIMSVQSPSNTDSGAMGLTSSVIMIGLSTLIHYLYRNI